MPTKKWKATGGDAALTFGSVANAAGRQGTKLNIGTSNYGWWRWYLKSKFQPLGLQLGGRLDLYFAIWNGDTTDPDGGGFIPIDADQPFNVEAGLVNLTYAGGLIIGNAAGNFVVAGSGYFFLPQQYVTPILWNRTGAISSAVAADTELWLTNIPASTGTPPTGSPKAE
jgi:hypothetical protein